MEYWVIHVLRSATIQNIKVEVYMSHIAMSIDLKEVDEVLISYEIVDDVTGFCYQVSNLTQISGTQGQMSRCKEIPSKTPFNFFSSS